MVMANEPIFKTAPEEVIRYFEQKGNQPSFDWRDVAPREHAMKFTVAKTAGFDVLQDLREAVDDAIRNQVSFEDFKDNIEPTLRRKGWWGRKLADDPVTGKPSIQQLGSVRRLRTIHWANVSTARAAGNWERIQRTKDFLPFLRYGRSISERRRPLHASWEGITLPVNHGWWLTHFPPNDWLCKCPQPRQLTRGQAAREGYNEDDLPPINLKPWKNKRTGETVMVPEGIGAGWQTNPGINRMRTVMKSFGERLTEMPHATARAAIKSYWFANEAKAHLAFNERVHMPAAISVRAQEYFKSPAKTITVSNDTYLLKSAKHVKVSVELMAEIDRLVDQGDWRYGKRPGTIEIYAGYKNTLWKIVIGKAKDGFMYLRTFHVADRPRGVKVK